MAKLNQILAVEKGVKAEAASVLTKVHQQLQKPVLLSGLSRTYRPKDDEGDQLPAESTKVQVTAGDAIVGVQAALSRWFDVTAAKDWTNTVAKADVVVGGAVLLAGVPVTYLLFLEKQLTDLHTFVAKLPTLDPAKVWHYDPNAMVMATEPADTTRTEKIPRNHVLAEATDRHPAQVQMYTEDRIVGYWSKVEFSGAMEARMVALMLSRVVQLQEAVKMAREQANGAEVVEPGQVGAVLDYIFRL